LKRILIILSEFGYWGEELVGPLETFDEAGYEVDFATPKGKRPTPLPPSMDPQYIDPPLGKSVTSAEVADKVKALDASTRYDHPIDISSWVPERPYWSSPTLLRDMEAYYAKLDALELELAKYDAMLIVGGSGPIVDIANNDRIHALILSFLKLGKPIGAECYGVTALCKEYDYKDGTGFIGVMFNMGPPPYPLEYILRDAVGPEGEYIGNVGHATSVIVDYPFITGRSTPDSYLTGEKIVEVLEQGLTRFGW
jgi:putative intracellular protease/amidase